MGAENIGQNIDTQQSIENNNTPEQKKGDFKQEITRAQENFINTLKKLEMYSDGKMQRVEKKVSEELPRLVSDSLNFHNLKPEQIEAQLAKLAVATPETIKYYLSVHEQNLTLNEALRKIMQKGGSEQNEKVATREAREAEEIEKQKLTKEKAYIEKIAVPTGTNNIADTGKRNLRAAYNRTDKYMRENGL